MKRLKNILNFLGIWLKKKNYFIFLKLKKQKEDLYNVLNLYKYGPEELGNCKTTLANWEKYQIEKAI